MALLIPQGLLNLQLAIFHSFSDLKYERKLSVETNDRLQLCSSGPRCKCTVTVFTFIPWGWSCTLEKKSTSNVFLRFKVQFGAGGYIFKE